MKLIPKHSNGQQLKLLQKIANYKLNWLELTKQRLANGGFDRLAYVDKENQLKEGMGFLAKRSGNNFSPKNRIVLLEKQPAVGRASDFNEVPDALGVTKRGTGTYTGMFLDAPNYSPRNSDIIASHEFSHLVYDPYSTDRVPLVVFNPALDKKYLLMGSNGISEQLARGTQLKNYYGLKEGEEITPEMWEYAKQNYVKDTGLDNSMQVWMDGVKDVPTYLKWLNRRAPIIVAPLGLYALYQTGTGTKGIV